MLTSRGWYVLTLALLTVGPARGQVTFLDTIGSGQLSTPYGLFGTADGRLFVADANNNRVVVYTQAAGSVGFAQTTAFGALGAGNGQFNLPSDVAVSSAGTVYVADATNNRVQYFTASGGGYTYQGQFGSQPNAPGAGNGQLDGPSSVAVSGTSVFVADTGNNRGQVFTTTTAVSYQSQFGNTGTTAQKVTLPAGVAVASDGTRYVADTGGHRIQAYNSDGTFRATIGGGGQLSLPTDLSVAPSGNLYVADTGNNRVRVYTPNGTLVRDLTGFNNPSDVSVAPTGQIFVSDTLNDRVQRYFDPSEWVSGRNTFATPVAGTGQLLGQSLTLNAGMTLESLTSLTVQTGGSVVLNGGTLTSTGTVAVAGTLTVRSGSTATSTGLVTVQNGGLLNGNGTLAGPVTVSGAIRPGEVGPALLRTGDLTLAAGGRYTWTVSAATGVAGTGWSQLGQSATNSLSVASTPADRFTVRLESVGTLPDFNPTQSYSWAIASYDTINGFSPDKFAIDASGFANSLGGGQFTLTTQGDQLFLNFTPVPEPVYALGLAAALVVLVRRIRC